MSSAYIFEYVSEYWTLLRIPFIGTHNERRQEIERIYREQRFLIPFSDDRWVNEASLAVDEALTACIKTRRGTSGTQMRELLQILSSWMRLGITREQLNVILFDIYLIHDEDPDQSISDMAGEMLDLLTRGLIEEYAEDPRKAHEAYFWLNPSWAAQQQ